MDKATAKVESLKEFDVKKDPEHVCSVMAYTDETKLYGKLNMPTHLSMLSAVMYACRGVMSSVIYLR